MRMMGDRLGVAIGALVGLALVAGCTAAVDRAGGARTPRPVVLHVLNTRRGEEAQPFLAKLAELSKGTLRLVVDTEWHSDSVTGEVDAVHAIESGQADLAIVPARAWHGLGVTSFDALIAPLAVDSYALQQKVLGSEIPDQMLRGISGLGLQGIGILPGPVRKPAGITRPLLTSSDFRGARIAISPSAVADKSLRALGAVPVASTFEGAPLAGLDGSEQQVSTIAENGYDEVTQSITVNVNLWPRPLVVFGSTKTLAALSSTQTGWLRAAVRDTLDATEQVQIRADTDGVGALCRRAKLRLIDASPAQVAKLREAFAATLDGLRRDLQTRQFLDRIDALRAGVSPSAQETLSCAGQSAGEAAPRSPANPPSASASPPPAGSRTVLDGVYEADVTRADMTAAGAEPVELEPENWGHWVFVFDHGRFADSQHNGPACTWGYGTFTVTTNQLELRFIDGGGIRAKLANKPGELFDYRWSRYRDLVSWSEVPDAESPLPWTVRPWHLISVVPTSRFFDAHCPPPATALTG